MKRLRCGTNILLSHWIRPRARHTPLPNTKSPPSTWFFIQRSSEETWSTGTTEMPLAPPTYTTPVIPPSTSSSEPPLILLLPCSFFQFSSSSKFSFLSSIEMALSSSKFSSVFLSSIAGDALKKPISSSSSLSVALSVPSPSLSLVPKGSGGRNFRVVAAGPDSPTALTGVIFEPFEEVKKDFLAVPMSPQVSMACQNYADECEAAINEQINVEYNVSYVYHSLFAYFDRDNIALKGFAKFFKEASEEERDHAEKLMKYQNIRGGRVVLHPIKSPPSEYEHPEKGDALYAMELALSLEKLTNEKLLRVHSVAARNNDPQMTEFIESEFLAEQVEAIKKIAEYVAQLRMVGKGHGVWHFDQRLLHDEENGHA